MTARRRLAPTALTCPVCGFARTYRSQALAAANFPRHSCEFRIRRSEGTARRIARLNEAGPEQPCTCSSYHEHGTRSRYLTDGCHCQPCRVANRVYEQDRTRRRLYGRITRVDAEPARQHVRALMAQGMGRRSIAAAASLADSSITALLHGRTSDNPGAAQRKPRQHLEQATADKILAVTFDLAPGALVDGPATSRRLQALVTIGWSQAKLAREIGCTTTTLMGLIHHVRQPTKRMHDAVRAVYDELWNQQPPQEDVRDRVAYDRSVRYAAEHHWAPPLAWDDDTIHDPATEPEHQLQPDDEADRPRRPGRQASVHPEDVEFLIDQGFTRDGIAQRLHVEVGTLQTSLQRASRRDLWVRLCEREQIRQATHHRSAA